MTEELAFRIVSEIHNLCTQWMIAFFFWRLGRGFLGESRKKNAVWLIPASYFLVVEVFWVVPMELDSFWVYTMGIGTAFVMTLLFCEGGGGRKTVLCVTFFAVRWMVLSMVYNIHMPLFDLEGRLLNRLTDNQFSQVWQWNLIHLTCYMLADLALSGLTFHITINSIIRIFSGKRDHLGLRETVFLLIPGIFGSVNYYVIHWIYMNFGAVMEEDVFQSHPYFHGVVLLSNVVTLLSVLLVLALFSDLEKKKEDEKKRFVLEKQMEDIQSYISEIEQVYSGIRGVRHDVKNHIAVMESLLEQGKYQETRCYLKDMKDCTKPLEYRFKTGNPVTDVIINEKSRQAAEQGILFESRFWFPQGTRVNAFDVSIILGNALGNALEACEHTADGYIKIMSFCRKNMYLLEVENKYNGQVLIEKASGLPETTKKDRELHGIGLNNIRTIAGKYCGTIQIETKGQKFCLTVMLKLE